MQGFGHLAGIGRRLVFATQLPSYLQPLRALAKEVDQLTENKHSSSVKIGHFYQGFALVLVQDFVPAQSSWFYKGKLQIFKDILYFVRQKVGSVYKRM